jgi:hypothetical protein
VKPASVNRRTAATMASPSNPHGMAAATSSSVTNWLAGSNAAVPGSSALTFQPLPNQ